MLRKNRDNAVSERLKATDTLMSGTHPLEVTLTSGTVELFQIQSWIINKSYMDDLICEAILNSLLKAPKNHIYNKWVSKIVSALSTFTMESPWVLISESCSLKKSDLQSHQLNLPVSRLATRSICTMIESMDWKSVIPVAYVFLMSIRKSSDLIKMITDRSPTLLSSSTVTLFNENTREYSDTIDLIAGISKDIMKTEAEIALSFSRIQNYIEAIWIVFDGIYMESCVAHPDKSSQTTATNAGHSLGYIRNKATANFFM